MKQTLLTLIVLLSIAPTLKSQCSLSIFSTDGYEVELRLTPTAIVAPSTCPWGYNFNVEIDYEIDFKGNNVPASLYNLQGNMGCGSHTNNFFNLPNSPSSGKLATTGNPFNNNSDCATATVGSLGCTDISIQISGPGIPNQTVSCSVALPVELIHFSAQSIGEEVHLTWQTASELNNDFFAIERSVDAKNWTPIEAVTGQGTTDRLSSYAFIDKQPNRGTNYYRLKQVDYDGAFVYSPIEVVNGPVAATTVAKAFPNPTVGRVQIPSNGASHPLVFNHLGKELTSFATIHQVGEGDITLDLRALPKGTYYIRLGSKTHRIVKL